MSEESRPSCTLRIVFRDRDKSPVALSRRPPWGTRGPRTPRDCWPLLDRVQTQRCRSSRSEIIAVAYSWRLGHRTEEGASAGLPRPNHSRRLLSSRGEARRARAHTLMSSQMHQASVPCHSNGDGIKGSTNNMEAFSNSGYSTRYSVRHVLAQGCAELRGVDAARTPGCWPGGRMGPVWRHWLDWGHNLRYALAPRPVF